MKIIAIARIPNRNVINPGYSEEIHIFWLKENINYEEFNKMLEIDYPFYMDKELLPVEFIIAESSLRAGSEIRFTVILSLNNNTFDK